MIKKSSNMSVLVLMVLASLLCVSQTEAASGSVTVTVTRPSTSLVQYSIAWTSTAGGAVSGNTIATISGTLREVHLIPGATTPTDLYDVLLNDVNGVDLLIAGGANASATATRRIQIPAGLILNAVSVDLVISNAGSAKTGTVVLLVETLK